PARAAARRRPPRPARAEAPDGEAAAPGACRSRPAGEKGRAGERGKGRSQGGRTRPLPFSHSPFPPFPSEVPPEEELAEGLARVPLEPVREAVAEVVAEDHRAEEVDAEAEAGRAEGAPDLEPRAGVVLDVVVPLVPEVRRVDERGAADARDAERGEQRDPRARRVDEGEAELVRREPEAPPAEAVERVAAQRPRAAEEVQPRAPPDVDLRHPPRGERHAGQEPEVAADVGAERVEADVGVQHVGGVPGADAGPPAVDGPVHAVERVVVDERDGVREQERLELLLAEELVLPAPLQRRPELDAAELRERVAHEPDAAVDLLVEDGVAGRRLGVAAVVALPGEAVDPVAEVGPPPEVDPRDGDVEVLEERAVERVGAVG